MDGGELLQTSHAPEPLHGAFSSSERQVRILNAVVEPPARPLFFSSAELSERGYVGGEAIRHDVFRFAVSLHQFPEEFQCRLFVSTFGNDCFQHLAFVINSPPEVVSLAINLHKDFVHIPLPFRV